MRPALEIAGMLVGVWAFFYVCWRCRGPEDPQWSHQRNRFASDATARELDAWTREQTNVWDVLYWIRRWRKR
jgi:hypothetical protein